MTPFLAILSSIIIMLVSLSDWRKGLLVMLLIGVLQDVLRKLTPGIPSYYIVWSMAIYMGVFVTAILSRALPPLSTLFLGDRAVRTAWTLFGFVLVLHLANAFFRWGSVAVPILGAIFYLGPPLAMLLGFAYMNSESRLRRFFLVYLLIFVPTALTVFLSPEYKDMWPVLREIGSFVGRELLIYDVDTVLESYSGVLRVGEIAAWHAATAASFLMVFAVLDKTNRRRILYVLLIAALVGVIVMTGRRKMLMTLSIFAIVQWALLARFKHGAGASTIALLMLGTAASFMLTLLEPTSQSSLYLQRSGSVFGDVGERVATSLMLMKSAFDRGGGIGLGAGTASQGIAYAGVDLKSAVGGSSESGLGKLMVELGLLGVFSVVFLALAIARRFLKNLRRLAAVNERLLIYQTSFLSLLFANIMTFTVATQVYGDYFILIMLGTIAGFVIRIDWVARTYQHTHQKHGN